MPFRPLSLSANGWTLYGPLGTAAVSAIITLLNLDAQAAARPIGSRRQTIAPQRTPPATFTVYAATARASRLVPYRAGSGPNAAMPPPAESPRPARLPAALS